MTSQTELPAPSPVALVTGAANRIGATITRTLHAAGYRVIVHYRHSEAAALNLVAELNSQQTDSACCMQADFSDPAGAEHLALAAFAHWGRMDVLVNNASAFFPTPLAGINLPQWRELMNSNAYTPLLLCRYLGTALCDAGGNVINIIDSTAMGGIAGFAPYTMAKAALANMTRSLARELAPRVRVNGIAPGAILWPEYEGGLSEMEQQKTLARIPLGHLGTPQDIANTVVFLINSGSYITGQVIAVDGGAALGI